MRKYLPTLVQNDSWLEPYSGVISDRMIIAERKELELTNDKPLIDFATGYLYFGLHKTNTGWVIREWAPNATHIFLVGTFNNWNEETKYSFVNLNNGIWELILEPQDLSHGDLYAIHVHWAVNSGKRIPAWATRVVQDSETHMFNAQVWFPKILTSGKIRSLEERTNRR